MNSKTTFANQYIVFIELTLICQKYECKCIKMSKIHIFL